MSEEFSTEKMNEFHQNIAKTLASTAWYFYYEGFRHGEGSGSADGTDASAEYIRRQFEIEFRESVGQEMIENLTR